MVTAGSNRTVQHVHPPPLMRPLTPSSVGPSLHQIEHQLLEAEVQLENYTSGLLANFELMRCRHDCDHHPPLAQAPPPLSISDSATHTHTSNSPPGVTLGGSGDLEEGLNVGDLRDKALYDDGYLKDVGDDDQKVAMVDCVVSKEERLRAAAVSLREEGRPATCSGHGSRPSTRGSR